MRDLVEDEFEETVEADPNEASSVWVLLPLDEGRDTKTLSENGSRVVLESLPRVQYKGKWHAVMSTGTLLPLENDKINEVWFFNKETAVLTAIRNATEERNLIAQAQNSLEESVESNLVRLVRWRAVVGKLLDRKRPFKKKRKEAKKE